MARIRSVRPEFCTSLAIAELDHLTQLHFVRLWTHCDDEGRAVDDPRLLKGACWPLDDAVGVDRVEQMQAELERNGRIVRYEVDGRPYMEVVNWLEHQRPNRPVASKLPAPVDPMQDKGSVSTHEQLTEDSVSAHEHLTPVVVDVDGEVVGDVGDAVRRVFDEWVTVTGRTQRTVLDAKRRRRITQGLKTHGLDVCLDAVRGWQHSAWHRGENPDGKVYDDLELILRDAAKIEGFAGLWRNPPKGSSKRERDLVTAAERFLTADVKELTRGVS